MLRTMRMVRLRTLRLVVLTILAVLTIGAFIPASARAAGGRVLTAQDVVSIKVVNQPDMDTTTRVETDGTISFPYVGRIRAAGLSEDQVAHAIERQLASRQIVTEPHVLVEITTFGTQAAVEFFCNPDSASGILSQISTANGGLRPFEAVLETTIAGGVPMQTRLVTLRIH